MLIDIYKDHCGYVTDEVSSVPVDEANANEENRIKFVTDLAAVSRGKSSSDNPSVRYKSLLKEAVPNDINIRTYTDELFEYNQCLFCKKPNVIKSPSRPLEFLPVVLDIELCEDHVIVHNSLLKSSLSYTFVDFNNQLGMHSYISANKLYTNMRACINAGMPYSFIPYNTKEELKDFRAIKAKIPMFVWAQVPNTHTMISKESQSDRLVAVDEYWLPDDFRTNLYNELGKKTQYYIICKKLLSFKRKEDLVSSLLRNYSQQELSTLFKQLGYPMEIYNRVMYYFKYKEVVMTGWYNNPKVWKHLILERNGDEQYTKDVLNIKPNWTQKETSLFVKAINTIITVPENDLTT